jgi:hypothetical protein
MRATGLNEADETTCAKVGYTMPTHNVS